MIKVNIKRRVGRNVIFSVILAGTFVLFNCDESNPADPIETDLLRINEFLASNDSTNTDENGENDDWIELYNGYSTPVDIGGMYLSDDPAELIPWRIPSTDATLTTIQSGGFLIIWCDEQTEQGPLHVDFKLSKGGESIILLDSNAVTVIDSLHFGSQETGISMGRTTDGGPIWSLFSTPTPGFSNE